MEKLQPWVKMLILKYFFKIFFFAKKFINNEKNFSLG